MYRQEPYTRGFNDSSFLFVIFTVEIRRRLQDSGGCCGGSSGLSSPPRSPGALQGVAADRILQLGAPVAADPVEVDVGTLAIAPDIEQVVEERPVEPSPGVGSLPLQTDPVVQSTPVAQ